MKKYIKPEIEILEFSIEEEIAVIDGSTGTGEVLEEGYDWE